MATLPLDVAGKPIPVLRPTATQTVVVAGSAVNSTAIASNVDVVRLVSAATMHYSLIGTATTSSVYLPAATVEMIRVVPGDVISVIGTGTMFITTMT